MIFAHARDAVFDRTKIQTRRLWKDGDFLNEAKSLTPRLMMVGEPLYDGNQVIGINRNGRQFTRWQVGKTYAIQEGRGTKSIGRIRITNIRLDTDIRNISEADVKAEGFETRAEFVALWESMYGKQYQAWVLEFELVEVA